MTNEFRETRKMSKGKLPPGDFPVGAIHLGEFVVGFEFVVLPGVNLLRNLEVDGCPTKEKPLGGSTLLMNVMYIIFPKGHL